MMGLDHLFDCARRVAKIAIFREVNRAHAATADAPHDFVTMIEDFPAGECLWF